MFCVKLIEFASFSAFFYIVTVVVLVLKYVIYVTRVH